MLGDDILESNSDAKTLIEISFVLPYKELEDTVNKVLKEHPNRNIIEENIYVLADEKRLRTIRFKGDVIIARGITAVRIKENEIHIPLIEIPVTGYDIIRAVNECTKRFKAKRIACIGSSNMIYGIKNIKEILGVELVSYHLGTKSEMRLQIKEAVQAGADAIIGGEEINQVARTLDVPSVTIEAGKEAIRQVLDEAIRTIVLTRTERAQTERFKTLMNYAYEGIVAIDVDGLVTIFNKCATEITHIDGEKYIGSHIDSVLPAMNLTKVLDSGMSELGNIFAINNVTIVANLVPIKVEQRTVGAIATFENVAKIQEVEGHIRKKTHSKGLVAKYQFRNIIGQNPSIKETIRFAEKYSKVDSNILLVGETGTGKELFVQSIHNMSNRQAKPFVAVNCAAIPEQLLESELFGYAEGAFTGATKGGKQGYFELAHGGTLFLDEISELSLNIQGRLLRVLQEKEIMPIGANKVIPVDVRILSATNKNLQKLVADGLFRQDLLYRLDVLRLFIPPLRIRKSDIPLLIQHFLQKYSDKQNNKQHVSPGVMQMLSEYSWPGNIRELKNFCERLAILAEGETIEIEVARKIIDFDGYISLDPRGKVTSYTTSSELPNIRDIEASAIHNALNQAHNNKTLAAKMLGIHKTTLWRKMKKHGIMV